MPILFLIQCIFLIPMHFIRGSGGGLTQSELKANYGQDGTTFNDGKSCYRDCDGERKTCYYEFNVQVYDTMTGVCGKCNNGTICDCFNNGCITGNGVERVIMTVNQQMPGPTINVCKGDRIIVDVTNHMAGQELTIHFHGLHQKGTPWYDGVAMITQCPINSGDSFRYIFMATEAGTHFYYGSHRNGIVGRLVVRELNDPNANSYDYDLAEHSVLLTDWDYPMGKGKDLDSNVSDSILINGAGNYLNPKTGEYAFAPIAVFYVQRSKKHRFRFANAGSHVCPMEMTIRDHKLTVIATDGVPIEPIIVESLVATPGERMDVVMDATTLPEITQTILSIRGLDTCKQFKLQEFARIIFVHDIFNHLTELEDYAPLKERPDYESLDYPKVTLNYPLTDCSTSYDICLANLQQKNSTKVENLRNVTAESISMHFQMIAVQKRLHNYMIYKNETMVTVINRIANVNPPLPPLIQDAGIAYCNSNQMPENCVTAADGKSIAYCPHLIDLKLGEVYELLLVDDDPSVQAMSHSMHLHGHSFQVIDMGTRDQLNSGESAFTNATHPPVIKDTIAVPNGGFVRIRFRATNPGFWIFHSHSVHHMESGMTVVLKVGDRNEMPTPPTDFPTCGNYLEPFTGRAISISPFSITKHMYSVWFSVLILEKYFI